MKRILVSACLLGTACRYDGRGNANDTVLCLMDREDICLIPVCPEQLGGLSTPRTPSERTADRVINRAGEDVTEHFRQGAEETLAMAERFGCELAILKERSPSCGCGAIYDGSFSGVLTDGNGVTAELLLENGLSVFGESQIADLMNVI